MKNSLLAASRTNAGEEREPECVLAAEGVVLNLNVIRKNIQENLSVLEDKEFSADVQKELDTLSRISPVTVLPRP